MNPSDVASATTTIQAPVARVWDALINPDMIKRYLFGTNTTSDWKPGSPIRWTGEWQGRAYEDKGAVLDVQPGRLLRFTHFSPLSGLPDTPDSYQTVTMTLTEERPRTTLVVSWDKNPTEEARRHNEANWKVVLEGLKKLLEEC
ncbi:MAG TPA: SRPBCC family protein [Vicinamibacterales bacterium]|nr:SRPBCC family protein [Vicinamibacterales bacterium]